MNSKFIYSLVNGKQVIIAIIESGIMGALDPVLRQRGFQKVFQRSGYLSWYLSSHAKVKERGSGARKLWSFLGENYVEW